MVHEARPQRLDRHRSRSARAHGLEHDTGAAETDALQHRVSAVNRATAKLSALFQCHARTIVGASELVKIPATFDGVAAHRGILARASVAGACDGCEPTHTRRRATRAHESATLTAWDRRVKTHSTDVGMQDVIFAQLVTLQTGAATTARGQPLDPWNLVLNASPVVMLVLIVLVFMSLACWFIIGAKLVVLSRATRASTRFLERFWDPEQGNLWSVERLESIYTSLLQEPRSPLSSVFHAGYVELARVLGSDSPQGGTQKHYGGDIDNIARALRRASGNEITSLESLIPFLATTGSTGPFVGLFGTVWGIMNAFINIGAQKNASLDVVAPGIAEALIATAIGLVAAIPAVMAYNYFVRRIAVLSGEMEAFSSDLLNIVRRHFLAS